MTLEQIKQRQERINEQLYTLLSNTEGVMNTIIGVQPIEESIMDSPQPNGLIQEINLRQDIAEVYIERLIMYNQLLINYTYSPVEVECQVKS